MKWICLLILVFSCNPLFAQTAETPVLAKRWFDFQDKFHSKKAYIYWGYNRDTYSNSDIHFHGNGYDFTLYDAKAHDKQSPITTVYINPGLLSIPQYNYRVGFYLKHNFHLSVGLDHMKYVLSQTQTAEMSGVISPSVSQQFAGTYINQPKLITPDFLWFQHTNGLNLLTVNLEYLLPVYHSASNKLHVGLNSSIGGFSIITKTEDVLLGTIGAGGGYRFHYSGFAMAYAMGPRIEFGKHFFVSYEFKVGYVYLPWVDTAPDATDRADHSFSFLERYGVVGYTISLAKKNKHAFIGTPKF